MSAIDCWKKEVTGKEKTNLKFIKESTDLLSEISKLQVPSSLKWFPHSTVPK